MHGVLHLLGTVIVIPYALLAGWFLMVGEVARARGLWGVLDAVLTQFHWMLGWGIYAIPFAFACLAVLGFIAALRRLGLLLLALIASASLLTIGLLHSGGLGMGELLFLSPCALILAICAWLYRRTAQPDSSDHSR